MKNEIYFIVDIEADGPLPGPNSMLNFGCVAISHEGRELSTFEANLAELQGASPDPKTMAWWREQPAHVWDAIRYEPEDPGDVMISFNNWALHLCDASKGLPVLVSMPATYDHMWIYWYSIYLTGSCTFRYSGLDVKSAAWYALGCDKFRHAAKRNFPKDWFRGATKHTHNGLDDARQLAAIFCNMVVGRKLDLMKHNKG